MQSFEEILRSSGYSIDQVRGIANELAEKKKLEAASGAANAGGALDSSAAREATPQTSTIVTGGIHTNDGTTVKQYFSYYAKLAN